MKTKTYGASSGLGKTGQTLREFGERQNALNAQLASQVQTLTTQVELLAGQLGDALEKIAGLEQQVAALQAEQERNIKRFGRCAAELDAAEKEISRLKLTAKLNTNAIDRLSKKE